jgi:hypothetical protein
LDLSLFRAPGVNHVTAFIDVQGNLLFWVVCG